ncbi:MAG: type II 3-dehydroquinate dehydratase, partial [Deltaproteobacteria bacterium]|nr:type II 3-dehydroquinate dehydratase [Deltaproteobacteria bacterium]
MVDWVQQNRDGEFLLVNAGAYTHTSVALRDAIKMTGIRTLEIHISNIHSREPFRHHSYLSDIAVGVIAGFGPMGYELATLYALRQLG